MDLYASIVFVHAATILLFFVAHGTSMAVAFKLKDETDPARVRALLELSRFSLGAPVITFVIIGFLSGIAVGFMGEWWGMWWIWIALVLFVVAAGLMTPLATNRLAAIGVAAGLPARGKDPAPATENPEAMRQLISAWNPLPIAAFGLAAFIVLLWLMMVKPF